MQENAAEAEDSVKVFIDELMNSHVLEIIVQQGLKRLNEKDKDEADAVQNLLTVVENVRFFLFILTLALHSKF